MLFRHLYACQNSNMSYIHLLPVELLRSIFLLGALSEPIPDLRDLSLLPFEVSVSHVCRHWRHIALHTHHLWTTVHFRIKSHMHRAKLYLSRSHNLPIDIFVDTCSAHTYKHRQDLLFSPDFFPVFDIVLPHINRWREFHLKVADLECKGYARKVLNTCGRAPLLQTLQLWHVQNWRTAERLFGAIGPPPVVVFAGDLPSLKNIILQGVNLPWQSSPFLSNLTTVEYALHSDDVRMPWEQWRAMLDSSPNLERLSLHYSGPRARSSGSFPPDGIDWWGADPPAPGEIFAPGTPLPPAADPVVLPRLQEMQLHDLDCDYLLALLPTLEAPALHSLHLELDTEEQDFTPFVDYLAAPSLRKPPSSLPHDARSSSSSLRPAKPKFPKLERLSVTALAATLAGWRRLLESARTVRRLEVDFASVPEGAFGVLFGTVCAGPDPEPDPEPTGVGANGVNENVHGADGVNGVRHPEREVQGADEDGDGEGQGEVNGEVPIMPALETLRVLPSKGSVGGVSCKDLARLAGHRRERGYRIRRWEVEEGARDVDGDELEREMEAESARWRAEREREGTGAREPWRLDEPVEKLVWYREEVDEYDDEDEGEDEDGSGEEDADGDEDDGDGDGDGEADGADDEEP